MGLTAYLLKSLAFKSVVFRKISRRLPLNSIFPLYTREASVALRCVACGTSRAVIDKVALLVDVEIYDVDTTVYHMYIGDIIGAWSKE